MPKSGLVAGLYLANVSHMTVPVLASAHARACLAGAGYGPIAACRSGLARGP